MQIASNSWFGIQSSNSIGVSVFPLPTATTSTATQRSSRNFNLQVTEWTGSASQTNYWTMIANQSQSVNQSSTLDIGFGTTGSAPSLTNIWFRLNNTTGNLGLGMGTSTSTQPTAKLHITSAGTTTAGSGPLKLTEGVNPTSAEDGLINYVSNNLTFTETSTVYIIPKQLTGSGTIDFGSVAAQGELTSNITVTGASDGDKVILGWTNAAESAGLIYTARVSASNTVTVKASNITLVPIDPASGTFKVSVIKD